MAKIRDLDKEYGHLFDISEGEGLVTTITRDSDGKIVSTEDEYQMSEDTFLSVIEEAEERGREAARRELINAVTDISGIDERRVAKLQEVIVNIGYDFKENKLFRAAGIDKRPFMKSNSMAELIPDSELHLLPEPENFDLEFLKDTKAVDEMSMDDIHRALAVGWYQHGSELVYWDGMTWRDNPSKASRARMSYPPHILKEMEYLG